MRAPVPRLYLGTMTFGWSQTSSYVDEATALEMTKRFCNYNIRQGTGAFHHIDTARIYAGGKTEKMLGAVLEKLGPPQEGTLVIGTKAHPSQPGGLGKQGMHDQMAASLQAMKLEHGVGEYHLHQPDTEHSLLESLQTADEMIKEGKFCVLGMSNYHVSEVERAFELCKENNLTRPTVYQGLYNPLNRVVEKELLPLLKQNQCSFVAYNPLAAGLLAGKHKPDSIVKGRFKNNENYLPRFYTDKNFEAVELIHEACDAEGITMIEASYRWLLRHSALEPLSDGILLGASSVSQLDQNLDACAVAADAEKGALSDKILQAFDKAWERTEPEAFPYWRSYSADMPNRDSLDQGASYSAKKK